MLAWDTETDLIAEAKLAPELACLTYSDGDRCDIVHHADPALPRIVEWLLSQETTTANGAYDCAVLWAFLPNLRDLIWEAISQGRVHDVIIRQKLIDLGAGRYRRTYKKLIGAEKATLLNYTLSDIHARMYGFHMEKDEWRLKYGQLRHLPLEQWPKGAVQYATGDAVVTSRGHDYQEEIAAGFAKHNLWDELNQVRANWALHLMSCWGFMADRGQVTKVISQIDREMPDLIDRLQSVGLVRKKREKGVEKWTRSEKLAKQMMYSAVGDAGELTKTGYKKVKAREMTKEQALQAGYIKIDEEWCEISGYEALQDYYHFRQNQLLRSKLGRIATASKHSLPIQTSFEVLMETGRTSSRENKLIVNSMALQNPPRKGGTRECFIARPGCTLIAADYGQAESVSLSQVTYSAFGYSKMRDLLNADMDIHVDFGKEVMASNTGLKLTYEEAAKMRKTKGGINKLTGEKCFFNVEALNKEAKKLGQQELFITLGDMRQAAKAATFGFPGGLGWASFQSYARKAWGVELTGEQAKQLKKYWLNHFPEMVDYFAWIGSLVNNKAGKADIQQFMSQRWRGDCYYTQGCNTLFQGLTADAAKAALFEVSRRCYTVKSSALYGCRPVLFVHDEIIVEAPKEQAAEAAIELERVMIEVYQRYTPDVKITADAHLMDRWSKDAEAVFDERGKLIPWNPPQDEDERNEPELLVAA